MNPLLLLAVMAGGASGIFVFNLMGVGLTAPASPGSIIAILMMAERHSYVGLLLGVAAATAVSALVALPILKFAGKDTSLEEAESKKNAMKQQAKGIQNAQNTAGTSTEVKKITFACDAGMGSSAMGATVLKKKLKEAGITDIEVIHTPVSSIPSDVQIVVTHRELGERAAHAAPNVRLILITNFMAAPEYDELVSSLKK